MWLHYPELLQRPVPRYTSYPTAADFRTDVDAAVHEEALRAVKSSTPLSIYVHIPFCENICWYCGCNTARANKRGRLSAYLDALNKEIRLVTDLLGGKGRVGRISFGGGSPNALEPIEFVRLLGDIIIAFGAWEPTISVELDPRHLSDDWLSVIESTKVSNVSMGVQTLDPAVQQAIGRVQPAEDVARLTRHLRTAGVKSLNFDLMYGLPKQTLDSLMETLAQAAHMGPDRIALFGYAHVPSVVPRQSRIDAAALPAEDQRFAMAQAGYDFLTAAGYCAIGFDHFALPGDPLAEAARNHRLNRNFQGFTDDPAEHLIGLGASSISQFPGLYVQNAKNAGIYRAMLAEGRLPTERGVVRDAKSRACGTVIREILCHGQAKLPRRISPAQSRQLDEFARRGLISTSAGKVLLQPGAEPYARTIAAIFDPRLAQKAGRFSAPV